MPPDHRLLLLDGQRVPTLVAMTTGPAPLVLHPDRLLPSDPEVTAIARRLYAAGRDLPVISPHGHVDPRMLLDDEPFADPASLFVTPDHYVTRLLHASGVPLAALGVGRGRLPEAEAREVWRQLCAHWAVYRARRYATGSSRSSRRSPTGSRRTSTTPARCTTGSG